MSVLTVNLKHLYQRRGLWLFYVIVVLFALAGIAILFDDTKAGQGRFVGLIVLAFVVGLLLAVLPIEVLSKPFSYCLPGHRKMVRKFVFCVGIVFNIFGSLLFFVCPSLNAGQLILAVCSAFFAGLISYLFGAGLAFAVRNCIQFWNG
jgi:MFS family permease